MRQTIDLVGGFYTDESLPWSVQDTVNYLPVAAEAGGTRTPTKLVDAPGLRLWTGIPGFGIRGLHDVEGRLFAVAGHTLYEVRTDGSLTARGAIPGVGRVSMTHNQRGHGHELLVVNGSGGYVYNTGTDNFTIITDPGYPGAGLADFLDGYLMQVEPFGRFLFHSDLADALEYNTLDRFEAETQPDRVVGMIVNHQEVWAFGDRTIDVFGNVGTAQGTFQNKGVSISRGCIAKWSPAIIDNGVAWLGDDRVVYHARGYDPARISTRAIEVALSQCSLADIRNAFSFVWSDRGHSVYYLTVPNGLTFGYDFSTGLWHRRATWHPERDIGGRWRLADLVRSNGRWIGGDYLDGSLYILDWSHMEDGDVPLVRERVSPVAHVDGRRFTVDSVEVLFDTGGGGPVAEIPGGTLAITGDLPDGRVGDPVDYTYLTTGGLRPYRFRIVSGSLPTGTTMDPVTARVTGEFTAPGFYSWRVQVEDRLGNVAWVDDTSAVISVLPQLCGIQTEYVGGQAFPETRQIVLGPTHGVVKFDYATGRVPDRMVITFSDSVVIDTGYVGDPALQSELNAALAARGLPPSTIVPYDPSWVDGSNIGDPGTMTTSFTKSSAESIASVDVYAPMEGTAWKFVLRCPEEPDPDLSWAVQDMVQTWWIKPISARYGNSYYVGGVSRAGGQNISKIDVNGTVTSFTLATHEGDDHNAPSITRLPNGRLLAMYTRHGRDSFIRYRISTEGDDISAWGGEVTIATSNAATYTQVWIDSADRIHLFYRTTTTRWAHRYSDDLASTWSAEKVFLSTSNRPYIATVPAPGAPDTIRLAIAGHPIDSPDHNIYYAEVNLTTGDIASPGAVAQVNLYDASPAVAPSAFEVMYDAAASGQNTRMLDIGSGATPQVLFATFTDALGAEYREGRREAGAWVTSPAIAEAGPPIENPVGANYYFAGMSATTDNDVLYLARRDGVTANWLLERHAFDGSSWGLAEVVHEEDWRTFSEIYRPITPVGADLSIPVTVLRGEYSEYGVTANHTDHRTDVVFDLDAVPGFSGTVLYEQSFAGLTPGAQVPGWELLTKSSGVTGELFTAEDSASYFGGKYGRVFHQVGRATLWGVQSSSATDLRMRADMRFSVGSSGVLGLIGRWVDSNNRVEVEVDSNLNRLAVVERAAGVTHTTSVPIPSGLPISKALTLEMILNADTVVGRIYRSGVQVAEVEAVLEGAPQPGQFGFKSSSANSAATTVSELQRILVTNQNSAA